MAELSLPFEGLPAVWTVLFTDRPGGRSSRCSLWTVVLFVRGRTGRRPPARGAAGGGRAFTWVFLVPALNEEVTIRDSVERLLEMRRSRGGSSS